MRVKLLGLCLSISHFYFCALSLAEPRPDRTRTASNKLRKVS